MIEKKLQTIALKNIDAADETYRYSSAAPIDSLQASIQAIGLVNPVILQKKDSETCRIVCGFKRVAVLAALQSEFLQAFLIEEERPQLDIFLLAIQENQTVRPLNPVELARILDKLQADFKIAQTDIVNVYLPSLGYGKNPRVLQLYDGLDTLSAAWQEAIVRDDVSLDFAQDILKLPEKERNKIWDLVTNFHLGKNRQREFLGLLSDVARLEKSSIAQIFESAPVQKIQNEEKLTPSQKTERLKQWLWEKRFPRYVNTKSRYDSLIREAKLPENILIQSPPYFEGENYSVNFSFSSANEFQETMAVLQELDNKGVVKKLFELL